MLDILNKINFLITNRQRKGLIILTFLLFIGMILEVFGLGILMPALAILSDPEMIEKSPIASPIRNYFSEFSDQSFIFIFLAAIVLVYFFKSIFMVFLIYKQNRILTNISTGISNNLFSSYLSQPYSFHLNQNASELIKNIQVEIFYLYTFLISFITLFIEGGFVFSIIVVLIYIEPIGAISIGMFYGVLSAFFLKFTKNKLNMWGDLRQNIDNQISKITTEGLGGIKDLIILGKTSYFKDRFIDENYIKARLNSNQATVAQLPRFYLELISIVGLVSFIFLLMAQEKDTSSLITTLGIFVAGIFRIIPSLNRIIGASQTMKYYKPSVDIIFKEIKESNEFVAENNTTLRHDFKNKIEFRNLNFVFDNNLEILNGINLNIKKGQIIGVVGASGSGKSTLIDLIIGLQKPTSGEILIDELSDIQISQSWRNIIGYVSQTIYLTDDSIKRNIALGVPENEINEQRIVKLLKQVQLKKFINNLEQGINTRVGERGVQLSGGQRQRIGIARALYNKPDILILDEATSALDTITEKEVMDSIYNLKGEKTIIIIAHRLSTLNKADQIYKVVNGKIKKV